VPRRGGVVFSGPAKRDVEQIWTYIEGESGRDRADAVVTRIERACTLAMGSPQMGRAEPERGPTMRSILVHPYRVFYRTAATHIEVMRVIHTRRDRSKAWRDHNGDSA
jgi:toxin ParE1/3/4